MSQPKHTCPKCRKRITPSHSLPTGACTDLAGCGIRREILLTARLSKLQAQDRAGFKKKRQARSGAVAVECAIVLPLICLLLVGMIDLCRLSQNVSSAQNQANAGAMYGSLGTQHAYDGASIQTAALTNNTCDNAPTITSTAWTQANAYGTTDTYCRCSVNVQFDWSIPIPSFVIVRNVTYPVARRKGQ